MVSTLLNASIKSVSVASGCRSPTYSDALICFSFGGASTATVPTTISPNHLSVRLKRPEQGTTKHFVFLRNPMKSEGKSYDSPRDHNSQPWKDQKSARKGEIKNTYGARNESSRGSASEKPLKATSSTGMCKKNTGKMFRPLVENIQPEHEAKITGMLLEMSKSNAQKLLNSPNSLGRQVEKAVQILKAANS